MSTNTINTADKVKILDAYLKQLKSREIRSLLNELLSSCVDQARINLLTKLLHFREQPNGEMINQISESLGRDMDVQMIETHLTELLKVDVPAAIKFEVGTNASERASVATPAPEPGEDALVSEPTDSETAADSIAKVTTEADITEPAANEGNASPEVESKTTSPAKPSAKRSTKPRRTTNGRRTTKAKRKNKAKRRSKASASAAKRKSKASGPAATRNASAYIAELRAKQLKTASTTMTDTAAENATKKARAPSGVAGEALKLFVDWKRLMDRV